MWNNILQVTLDIGSLSPQTGNTPQHKISYRKRGWGPSFLRPLRLLWLHPSFSSWPSLRCIRHRVTVVVDTSFYDHYCINDKEQQCHAELLPAGFTWQSDSLPQKSLSILRIQLMAQQNYKLLHDTGFWSPCRDYKSCVWNPSELGIYRFPFAKVPMSLFTPLSYGDHWTFAGKSREPEAEEGKRERQLQNKPGFFLHSHTPALCL